MARKSFVTKLFQLDPQGLTLEIKYVLKMAILSSNVLFLNDSHDSDTWFK